MATDTFIFSWSGNRVVNSAFSIELDNGVLSGPRFETAQNDTGNSQVFQLSDNSFYCYGGVASVDFSASVECDGNELTGTVSTTHLLDSTVTVTTVNGGGTFVLPPGNTQQKQFQLPVADATAGGGDAT